MLAINKLCALSLQTTLPLQPANDNIFVDPANGDLWVAIMPKPLTVLDYFGNHSIEVPSKILHIVIDEQASSPFERHQIEEVFATAGDIVSATTVAVYQEGKLLIGTIGKDMLYCNVTYLLY